MKNKLTDHEKRALETALLQMKPLLQMYQLTPYQVAKLLEKNYMLKVTPAMIERRVGEKGKLYKHIWPSSGTDLMEAMARTLVALTKSSIELKPALVPLDPAIAEYLGKIDYPVSSEPEETDADVMSNRFDPVELDKKAIHV